MIRNRRQSAVRYFLTVAAVLFISPKLFALSEAQKSAAQAHVDFDAADKSTLGQLWDQHLSALQSDGTQNLLDAVKIDWNDSSQRTDFIWTVSQAGIYPYMITGDTAVDQRTSIHGLMKPYIERLMANADQSATVRQAYLGLSALNRIGDLVPSDMQSAAHEKYRATCIVAHPIRHRIKKALSNARDSAKRLVGKNAIEPRGSDAQTSEVEGASGRNVPEYAKLRKSVQAPDQTVGDLMISPLDILTPEMSRDLAEQHLRKVQSNAARSGAATADDSHHAFVIDDWKQKHLLGIVPLRLFITAPDEKQRVGDLMTNDGLITAHINMNPENATRLLRRHNLDSIPVIDSFGRLAGVFTHHAASDVSEQEATDDIHKLGGQGGAVGPYLKTKWKTAILSRGIPLLLIFAGEMATTPTMAHFQDIFAKAEILMNYIPLVLSIGGNAGAQSVTMIIRSLALGDIQMKDWWRVALKETPTGMGLGLIMGTAGFLTVLVRQAIFGSIGPHFLLVASTVGASAFGVALAGSFFGAMMPFLLRLIRIGKFRLDPAHASAPALAMIGDVIGLLIFCGLALLLLTGTIL